MKIEKLKSCYDKAESLFYFARMCSKIRLHALPYIRLLFAFVFVAGCASRPAVLITITEADIPTEALRFAHADIASGHPRICVSGGRGDASVAVKTGSQDVVSGLPRWNVSNGGMDSEVEKAVLFAKIYKLETLASLFPVTMIDKIPNDPVAT